MLIALNEANDYQRDAVQAIVTAHTDLWWHEFTDVWIVAAFTPAYWRDLIKPVIANGRTAVLVVRLSPNDRAGKWASFGPDDSQRMSWFRENYVLLNQADAGT